LNVSLHFFLDVRAPLLTLEQAHAQHPSNIRVPLLSPNVEPYPVDRDEEDDVDDIDED